jgi:hypothetical protein
MLGGIFVFSAGARRAIANATLSNASTMKSARPALQRRRRPPAARMESGARIRSQDQAPAVDFLDAKELRNCSQATA